MIGVSQWRAIIGLWNHCKIRLTNHRTLSNTARSPYKSFDIESGDCKCSLSCAESAHNLVTTSQVQNDSFFKGSFATVSGDTICRLVTLMFYLLFLLLLSGDVELNPGPITVEQSNSYTACIEQL